MKEEEQNERKEVDWLFKFETQSQPSLLLALTSKLITGNLHCQTGKREDKVEQQENQGNQETQKQNDETSRSDQHTRNTQKQEGKSSDSACFLFDEPVAHNHIGLATVIACAQVCTYAWACTCAYTCQLVDVAKLVSWTNCGREETGIAPPDWRKDVVAGFHGRPAVAEHGFTYRNVSVVSQSMSILLNCTYLQLQLAYQGLQRHQE